MEQFIDPAVATATLLLPQGPGVMSAFTYTGIADEIRAYQRSAWIGTGLMTSPIYDVYGPDAVKLLNSVCTNDFTTLGMNGLRHAVMCNEQGLILGDGVAIRIGEDRYRTYWMNPVISYYVANSELDVHGEDMTGTEYFIQIAGEKSLEILEDAFQADLHDIKFARHRIQNVDGMDVRVIRLGMSGNLAYEIHGPMAEYATIYNKVWESGKKFDARRLGLQTYNLFNHTEAGFPNINLHYPLPWLESGEGLAKHCASLPQYSFYNLQRILLGSVGDDLASRFVTPYDVGWEFLLKFNHDFIGRKALEAMKDQSHRTVVTLEWNPEDVAKVFATQIDPSQEPCEDISAPSDITYDSVCQSFSFSYRADKVFAGEQEIGITSGRIISYTYNSMISLGFIDSKYAEEGKELEVLWGTPGKRQMKVRAKIARFPYNSDLIRNENKDVEEIPHFSK